MSDIRWKSDLVYNIHHLAPSINSLCRTKSCVQKKIRSIQLTSTSRFKWIKIYVNNNFSWVQGRQENINGNKGAITSTIAPTIIYKTERKLFGCWNLCGMVNKPFSATNNAILLHQHKLHYSGEMLIWTT